MTKSASFRQQMLPLFSWQFRHLCASCRGFSAARFAFQTAQMLRSSGVMILDLSDPLKIRYTHMGSHPCTRAQASIYSGIVGKNCAKNAVQCDKASVWRSKASAHSKRSVNFSCTKSVWHPGKTCSILSSRQLWNLHQRMFAASAPRGGYKVDHTTLFGLLTRLTGAQHLSQSSMSNDPWPLPSLCNKLPGSSRKSSARD